MDKRKQKTREAIRNAYTALLLDRHTARITVTALAQKANIDRKTFYLHYDTLDDVLRDCTRQLIGRLFGLLEESGFFDQPFALDQFFQAVNQVISENMAFFQLAAMRSDLSEVWDENIRELTAQIAARYQDRVVVRTEVLYVYVRFALTGSLELYKDWLRGRLPFTIEEIGRIATDAAFEGFCTILK